jgi:phage baseplate assembly protein W
MKKTIKAADLDFSFQAHPVSGNLVIKKGADAIKQSVKTLLLLNVFEKPFSTISGNIRNKLFVNFNYVSEQQMKDDIRKILENYEPRVRVDDVNVDYDNVDLSVTVTYTIIGEETQTDEIDLVVSRSR